MNDFYKILEENPIIAAVKNRESLEAACAEEEIKVIFILFGDINSIASIVEKVHNSGCIAMVHIDLISGLASKDIAVDYIKHNTKADGIITTKPALIKRAAELGFYTVLRVFLIDSMAFENLKTQVYNLRPDFIEVLPGIMPKIISKLKKCVKSPIIAGGLISDKEDVLAALSAGATSVSTTHEEVWKM